MANTIKQYEVVEGNLKAVKDTSDFGGPNKWHLHVKETGGFWSNSIQWMNVYTIQKLFTKSLPVYREKTAQSKYELV